jgi:hypothetical protein
MQSFALLELWLVDVSSNISLLLNCARRWASVQLLLCLEFIPPLNTWISTPLLDRERIIYQIVFSYGSTVERPLLAILCKTCSWVDCVGCILPSKVSSRKEVVTSLLDFLTVGVICTSIDCLYQDCANLHILRAGFLSSCFIYELYNILWRTQKDSYSSFKKVSNLAHIVNGVNFLYIATLNPPATLKMLRWTKNSKSRNV